MKHDMKHWIFLLLPAFAFTLSAHAAEVDVTLKNGKKVTGEVLSQTDREIVLVVTASNGVYHQTVLKTDIASMKERIPLVPGVRDVARLQKSLKAAEDDVRRREADAAAAQKALDDYYGTHPVSSVASVDKERKLRARLMTTRTQAEKARSKLNEITADIETLSRNMTEPAPAAK